MKLFTRDPTILPDWLCPHKLSPVVDFEYSIQSFWLRETQQQIRVFSYKYINNTPHYGQRDPPLYLILHLRILEIAIYLLCPHCGEERRPMWLHTNIHTTHLSNC